MVHLPPPQTQHPPHPSTQVAAVNAPTHTPQLNTTIKHNPFVNPNSTALPILVIPKITVNSLFKNFSEGYRLTQKHEMRFNLPRSLPLSIRVFPKLCLTRSPTRTTLVVPRTVLMCRRYPPLSLLGPTSPPRPLPLPQLRLTHHLPLTPRQLASALPTPR
ncbi:hypothetical protein K435DRAFT_363141 [Dendrothele bispora CBS 962.96]|uniref:Uncharacterized protein n=1 Tax=Dendrothele bispora (strain CBS 962.96) TaxID=1314807 RepID=A0A4S8LD68_DENBC|nr:hypothetical protein K435DRAFT_363141 [Dendrothele bispora CBS 962.96]